MILVLGRWLVLGSRRRAEQLPQTYTRPHHTPWPMVPAGGRGWLPKSCGSHIKGVLGYPKAQGLKVYGWKYTCENPSTTCKKKKEAPARQPATLDIDQLGRRPRCLSIQYQIFFFFMIKVFQTRKPYCFFFVFPFFFSFFAHISALFIRFCIKFSKLNFNINPRLFLDFFYFCLFFLFFFSSRCLPFFYYYSRVFFFWASLLHNQSSWKVVFGLKR